MTFPRTPASPSVPNGLRLLLGAGALAVSTAVLAGCEDSPTDPITGLVTSESHPALTLGVELPDPVRLAGDRTRPEVVQAALDAWEASWALGGARGVVAREEVRGILAEWLADELEPRQVEGHLGRLTGAVAGVEAFATALPPLLGDALATGRAALGRAEAALASNRLEPAVYALLAASDALRSIGPEAVARDLVRAAEDAIGRVSEDDSYTPQDLQRAQRLVSGGRQAYEAGDWVRAIRRAYYARVLLEGNG